MQGEFRVIGHERAQLAAPNDRAAAVLDGLHRGRARTAIEGDLAETLAGPELLERNLVALAVHGIDFRVAREQEVDRIAFVALGDDDLVLGECAGRGPLRDFAQQRLGQGFERA